MCANNESEVQHMISEIQFAICCRSDIAREVQGMIGGVLHITRSVQNIPRCVQDITLRIQCATAHRLCAIWSNLRPDNFTGPSGRSSNGRTATGELRRVRRERRWLLGKSIKRPPDHEPGLRCSVHLLRECFLRAP